MDDLIVRVLQGLATPSETARLRRWRAASAANEAAFREIERLWDLTGRARPAMERTEIPDPDLLIEDAERRPLRAAPTPPVRRAAGGRPSRPWPRGRTWAGTAVAAGLVAVGFGLGTRTPEDRNPAGMGGTIVTTGAGELTTVALGDGSSVRVGPRSSLRIQELSGERTVWLEGRAFFGVHADSSRRFTVRTRHGEAVVFGTRFEVRAEDDEFRVLVVDGAVTVSAGGAETALAGGQMSRSIGGTAPVATSVADVYRHLEWMGTTLVFQRTPVAHALREIELRYDVDVVLTDPALADLALTMAFTDQPVDDVVSVLCEVIDTRCRRVDDRIVVGAGEPPPHEIPSEPPGPGDGS